MYFLTSWLFNVMTYLLTSRRTCWRNFWHYGIFFDVRTYLYHDILAYFWRHDVYLDGLMYILTANNIRFWHRLKSKFMSLTDEGVARLGIIWILAQDCVNNISNWKTFFFVAYMLALWQSTNWKGPQENISQIIQYIEQTQSAKIKNCYISSFETIATECGVRFLYVCCLMQYPPSISRVWGGGGGTHIYVQHRYVPR